MDKLPMLFKRTKTGAAQMWDIVTDNCYIVTVYGQVNGKLQKETYAAKAKNVGRSNETTDWEQAELEAKAKWEKQLKKGYVEDPSGENELTLPPLAKKYQDAKSSIKWPAYVSCKYDGLRCTVFYRNGEVVMQSRGGESYPVIEHIADELVEDIFKYTPNAILDGELYKHGMHLEDIVRACKTTKHTDLREQIKFYVFDYLDCKEDSRCLHERLGSLVDSITGLDYSIFVDQGLMFDEKEMLDLHKRCVYNNYEGVVIRNTDSIFKFGERTSDFQKYKVAEDAEFLVVGMEKTKQGGGVCVCEYFKPDGSPDVFKVNVKCTKEEKQELWNKQDEYIGKWLNVSFEKLSKYHKPTKGVGEYFRDCNEKGEPLE